jgi:hypothetical protein
MENFYLYLKTKSEAKWKNINPNKEIFGYQIQTGSKWKRGLSLSEISSFEKELNIEFPSAIKDYYLSMNGLDKNAINYYGSSGEKPKYRPVFYSYPDDLEIIKDLISWIYEAFKINRTIIKELRVSRIFPIFGHRFILIDHPGNPILSMQGTDAIPWASSLESFFRHEILEENSVISEFDYSNIKLWLD